MGKRLEKCLEIVGVLGSVWLVVLGVAMLVHDVTSYGSTPLLLALLAMFYIGIGVSMQEDRIIRNARPGAVAGLPTPIRQSVSLVLIPLSVFVQACVGLVVVLRESCAAVADIAGDEWSRNKDDWHRLRAWAAGKVAR